MKQLIFAMFLFAFLNTTAQVVLSPEDKALMEQEVKLIYTQNLDYFASIIKDKGQYDKNGIATCILKTKPFSKIRSTSGFVIKCERYSTRETSRYVVNIRGKGKEWEDFETAMASILDKLTAQGVFEIHSEYYKNYCVINEDRTPVNPNEGVFALALFEPFPAINIWSLRLDLAGNFVAANIPKVIKPIIGTTPVKPVVPVTQPKFDEAAYKESMENGDKAMAKSDYPVAITNFKAASALNAEDYKSQLMLGIAQLEYAELVFDQNNTDPYHQYRTPGLSAIRKAYQLNPENPVVMYYNWRYVSGSQDDAGIALLTKIIENTHSSFREPVYMLCKTRLMKAFYARLKINNDRYLSALFHNDLKGSDELINSYRMFTNMGLRDFQFILKNYAAEPMELYQFAGYIYLMEYKIDSAVYCLQKVKDNASKIKWVNTEFDQYYETAKIYQIRLQHHALEDIIKSDDMLRNKNYNDAIAIDKYNAMAYVKRAEANEQKELKLGVEYLKENAASHKLSVADYESAKNIYPPILQGKANEVIAFLNKWIYDEEHFTEVSTVSSNASGTYSNYSAPTDLYNIARTPPTRYETLLNCSYCRGTGEVFNPNGGFSTNTYYLLGGSGMTYQGTTYNSTYIKCDKCKGTGKIVY